MSSQRTNAGRSLPVLDLPATDAQLGALREAVVDELLGLWLGDLDDRVAAISTAAGAGDARALAFAAHKLRGSSMYVGATRLADSCVKIERLIDDLAAWPAIDAEIAPLRGHARDARAALTVYRSGRLAGTATTL